jgi:hypothetical protein
MIKQLGFKVWPVLGALLFAPASHADIYKWVDANGKTHYSDTKDAAGKAQVNALRPVAAPTQAPAPASGPSWQEREREFKARRAREQFQPPSFAPQPRRLSTTYGTNAIDTDKAKCELARDVTSGAVRHGNGAVTDTNDRQIAQRDIQTFCR